MSAKRYALLSVYRKAGIIEFARGLQERGFIVLSTGGTFKELTEVGKLENIVEVAIFTGQKEILGGRVKILHPKIFAGILNRRGHADDMTTMDELGWPDIDVVAINLYPFEATITKPGCTEEVAIENIDIGGPSGLRAAAKAGLLVTADPDDYDGILQELSDGKPNPILRRRLRHQVYVLTAAYDTAIANYLADLPD